MKTPKGYLFKRWQGKHLPAESEVPATFYLSYEHAGKRSTLCLHTMDRRIAESLAQEHMGKLKWTDRESFLRALIEMGDAAKRELFGRVHEQDACPIPQLWDRYLASRRRPQSGPGTLAGYKAHVMSFQKWAPQTAKSTRYVSMGIAEAYVKKLEAEWTSATVAAHIATLRRVWRVVDPEAESPWLDIKPSTQHVVVPYRRLSVAECRAIVKVATTETAAFSQELLGLVLIGYYTGLRMADAVSIRLEHWDQEAGILVLPPPRKTARRKPGKLRIPVLPELSAFLKSCGDRELVLPMMAAQHIKEHSKVSDLVIDLFHAAKVINTEAGRASFHSLRASFISAMDEVGAPSRVTDSITNHAPRTMHDRYSQPELETARTFMLKALLPIMPNQS